MPRAMWRGTINCGLVSVPVKLYAATESGGVEFHRLHRPCNARLNEKLICSACGKNVTADEIVKGVEAGRFQYVAVDDRELEALAPHRGHTIDVRLFTKDKVPARYYEKEYYLEPEDAGVRAFLLFTRAMQQNKSTAIASFVLRTRQRMGELTPTAEGGLVLHALHYHEELREIPSYKGSVVLSELAEAKRLIGHMTEKLDPATLVDHYRQALTELVAAKLAGEVLNLPIEAAEEKKGDLMDLIRESIAQERDRSKKIERAKQEVA